MKYIFYIFTIVLLFSVVSCKKDTKNDATSSTNKKNTPTLTDTSTEKTINIKDTYTVDALKGKVEINSDTVYIVQLWTTRSRISLEVLGNKLNEVKANVGKILTVSGEVNKTSQWSGTIKVSKIISIE